MQNYSELLLLGIWNMPQVASLILYHKSKIYEKAFDKIMHKAVFEKTVYEGFGHKWMS